MDGPPLSMFLVAPLFHHPPYVALLFAVQPQAGPTAPCADMDMDHCISPKREGEGVPRP